MMITLCTEISSKSPRRPPMRHAKRLIVSFHVRDAMARELREVRQLARCIRGPRRQDHAEDRVRGTHADVCKAFPASEWIYCFAPRSSSDSAGRFRARGIANAAGGF